MSQQGRWDMTTRHQAGPERPVSVYRVIAYNLAEARRERRLTQDELGERLEALTGRPWSRATVSAAESGWDAGRKVRHFDVMEVAAFAMALKLPIPWFFLPPPTTPGGALPEQDDPWISVGRRESGAALSSGLLSWLILSHRDAEDPDDLLARRLRRQSGPEVQASEEDLLGELYELVVRLQAKAQSRSGPQ